MEENSEEKFKKRVEKINKKLEDPKIKKKIERFVSSLGNELKCEINIFYDIYPEVDEYMEFTESDEFEFPKDIPLMNLGEFIDHIKNEDEKFKLYVDPIYLKKGLNEINDVLTTTIDDKIIIVPISIKTNKK